MASVQLPQAAEGGWTKIDKQGESVLCGRNWSRLWLKSYIKTICCLKAYHARLTVYSNILLLQRWQFVVHKPSINISYILRTSSSFYFKKLSLPTKEKNQFTNVSALSEFYPLIIWHHYFIPPFFLSFIMTY